LTQLKLGERCPGFREALGYACDPAPAQDRGRFMGNDCRSGDPGLLIVSRELYLIA